MILLKSIVNELKTSKKINIKITTNKNFRINIFKKSILKSSQIKISELIYLKNLKKKSLKKVLLIFGALYNPVIIKGLYLNF